MQFVSISVPDCEKVILSLVADRELIIVKQHRDRHSRLSGWCRRRRGIGCWWDSTIAHLLRPFKAASVAEAEGWWLALGKMNYNTTSYDLAPLGPFLHSGVLTVKQISQKRSGSGRGLRRFSWLQDEYFKRSGSKGYHALLCCWMLSFWCRWCNSSQNW